MSKTMLIDAAHPEETRVVVLNGNSVEDFDFESKSKQQLRGNIYLAKVTRVEPSLQASFVEYGGNRHGFLAFGEIHPDYYQIPAEDRARLLAEEAAYAQREDGAEDDEFERARRAARRDYKIQEVIRRRQIMLVQAVKEERGNKGAALTTYLSLAGRYCVLMPNTPRGGGISRKITSVTDRKRLKSVVADLHVPQGMGLIIRTAGAKRTKTEIKRDYEYLLRAWDDIRERTLQSVAPCLIHEEDNLVKRAMRDLYDKDVEAVLVEGEGAYREAKDFVKMLMPSHAKKVQQYKNSTPLFSQMKVERQLASIHEHTVQLKSGGYIVINQTEALVAIDVNSGRATKERSIEATALKTNLEAADEAARQMRMRDLAGLIVIDFIDMEESRNTRAVEKRLKDAMRMDRARVQMGRISMFGLMEISRQRRRTGVLEGSSHICPTCNGTGRVRSPESAALQALRDAETSIGGRAGAEVLLRADINTALYILNEKRAHLAELEASRQVMVRIQAESTMPAGSYSFEVVNEGEYLDEPEFAPLLVKTDDGPEPDMGDPLEVIDPEAMDGDDEDEGADGAESGGEAGDSEGGRGRRRRRRRRRGGSDRDGAERGASGERSASGEDGAEGDAEGDEDGEGEGGGEAGFEAGSDEGDEASRRRRRRGRRGGRRRRRGDGSEGGEGSQADSGDEAAEAREPDPLGLIVVAEESEQPTELPSSGPPPKRARPPRRRKAGEEAAATDGVTEAVGAVAQPVAAPEAEPEAAPEPVPETAAEEPAAAAPAARAPRKSRARKTPAADAAPEAPAATAEPVAEPVAEPALEPASEVALEAASEPAASSEPASEEPSGPRRTGWWARNAKKLFGE